MKHREARPSDIYRTKLAILTDLYQLTMAYGYYHARVEKDAVFHLYFRNNPFKGGYAIAGGLASAIDLIENFSFSKEDLLYLSTLTGQDGKPLFDERFLNYLSELRLNIDVDAVREGEVVFAHEPLVRVKGSIIQCQLLETALLNFFNFETLIATKASRVAFASQGRAVLEFGLRRAQGVDGALSASRAAYLGGCDATSNVLAGRLFGIPVKGTHAHSWVMSFEDEASAFHAYAEAMPNNCIFLVDTYDTLHGVAHAIEEGKRLRARGFELGGIRLDSGDLAYLSAEARKMLDSAGFTESKIVASNDLDEEVIASLIEQGACIDIWGVGTNLVTAANQPALGGVYKLSCVRDLSAQKWQYRLKLSEQAAKISTPGVQQVRRFYNTIEGEKRYLADMIFDCESDREPINIIVDPLDVTRRKSISSDTYEDLLVPIFRSGKLVYQEPTLQAARSLRAGRLKCFHPTILRLLNAHQYPVGLEAGLSRAKTDLILKERGFQNLT